MNGFPLSYSCLVKTHIVLFLASGLPIFVWFTRIHYNILVVAGVLNIVRSKSTEILRTVGFI